MDIIEIKSKIKDYLRSSFHLNSIDDSTNIFETGLVNSLFFIQLLVFIEKTFDLQLEEGEFDVHILVSVNAISDLLFKKLSQKV
jgi:methoxymalonate biosynthesis acyl carrier protein